MEDSARAEEPNPASRTLGRLAHRDSSCVYLLSSGKYSLAFDAGPASSAQTYVSWTDWLRSRP